MKMTMEYCPPYNDVLILQSVDLLCDSLDLNFGDTGAAGSLEGGDGYEL